MFNILFLCTGNSARSLIAEAVLDKLGVGKFQAYSAGSQPKGAPHPETLSTLDRLGYATGDLRSKSWDEFAAPDAPEIDLVITVCANAANEACPVWPGAPMSAHWGLPDPAGFEGSDEERAACFVAAHDQLYRRIEALVGLDWEPLSPAREAAPARETARVELLERIRAIGDLPL